MRIEATARAVEVVERARRERGEDLTITLGTGCCESTAPFLYDNYYVAPDQEQVGQVAGVTVYAPPFLCRLYDGDRTLVVDVTDEGGDDSFSVETEWGVRLILRGSEYALDR